MLIKIGLIIAIIGALVAGGFNFFLIKDKVTNLQAHDQQETKAHQEFETKYTTTKRDLDKTNAVLKTTIETLNATTEAKVKAETEAETQAKRATKLAEDLTKTQGERDGAQQELAAYKAAGLRPEEIAATKNQNVALTKSVAGLEGENKFLGQKVAKLQNELAFYRGTNQPVFLPAALKGKVIVFDPKWNFVVLNIGGEQGVLEHGELLVNRNGRLVAKVRVSSVQKDRCVANIVPGWKIGDVIEGDLAIPAYPET